ncbi:hypothetical protein MNV49_005990 [Pseudohyphozyma bogoriensis]|nr:hypothetical protein MNV49_005990 [Pseudohyphozyma bogoriensis]
MVHPQIQEQIDSIPHIKSPSFYVNPPVELPPDIHPLPLNITDYFVYPLTLEPHALNLLSQSLLTFRTDQTKRLELLKRRDEEQEAERRRKLNAIAPGWGQGMGVLEFSQLSVKEKEKVKEVVQAQVEQGKETVPVLIGRLVLEVGLRQPLGSKRGVIESSNADPAKLEQF